MLQDDNKLRVTLLVGGLASNVTGVELHTGSGNDNGRAASMDASPNTQGGWAVNTVLTLSDDVAASVRAGNAYLLVTSADHPTGALRGQLLPQPVRLPSRARPEPVHADARARSIAATNCSPPGHGLMRPSFLAPRNTMKVGMPCSPKRVAIARSS